MDRAELSTAFAASRSVALTLRTHPLLDVGLYDTAFDRCEPVSPDHVLGLHVTPPPPGGEVPPGRQPSCARFLLCLGSQASFASP